MQSGKNVTNYGYSLKRISGSISLGNVNFISFLTSFTVFSGKLWQSYFDLFLVSLLPTASYTNTHLYYYFNYKRQSVLGINHLNVQPINSLDKIIAIVTTRN